MEHHAQLPSDNEQSAIVANNGNVERSFICDILFDHTALIGFIVIGVLIIAAAKAWINQKSTQQCMYIAALIGTGLFITLVSISTHVLIFLTESLGIKIVPSFGLLVATACLLAIGVSFFVAS